jgi:hypothetical protein
MAKTMASSTKTTKWIKLANQCNQVNNISMYNSLCSKLVFNKIKFTQLLFQLKLLQQSKHKKHKMSNKQFLIEFQELWVTEIDKDSSSKLTV